MRGSIAAKAKNILKRSRILRRINTTLKNVRLERDLRRLETEYSVRVRGVAQNPPSLAGLIASRKASGRTRDLRDVERPTIFLVGTYFEQENSGFIQALEAVGDVVALRTRTGAYGLAPPRGPGDRATAEENSRQIVEQVKAAHMGRRVDVLIGTMVAQSVDREALVAVRGMGIPVLNIAMDDRLPDHWIARDGGRVGAIGLADAVDLVLHTTPDYIPRYLAGGHPAVFWPFGSDPSLFTPSATKRFDVSFVGNNYGWRGTLIEKIQRAGISIECFGNNFPNGHIDVRSAAEVLNASRIVLGVATVAHSRRVVTLKLRDFDGPMSGALYITTDNPDLYDLYKIGEEIIVYRSPEECIALIRKYLADAPARERIAAAGRRRAERDHTWRQRIDQAFGLVGWRGAAVAVPVTRLDA